ncbi:hypothetical protein [Paremcibacter congregatus]|uniref:hypothetical protein n=1 Tax=Paremcibacter congregatus TaxID=2043170 RepID=UPI003A90FF00
MFPRYRPRDQLFIQPFLPSDYASHPDADIVVATSDGRLTLGQFHKHDGCGVTITQLSHDEPHLIAQYRAPILYRVTGFAPAIPAPLRQRNETAA